jgi:endonuclease VIII
VPEGHTLHRLALDLTAAFGGRIVSVTSPQGRFADSAAILDQTRMVEATAHGKHLFGEFADDRFLHVHLGLIGKFTIGPEQPPWGEVRVRIAADGQVADLRGPQLCAVVPGRRSTPPWRSSARTRCGPMPTPSSPGIGSGGPPARSRHS